MSRVYIDAKVVALILFFSDIFANIRRLPILPFALPPIGQVLMSGSD